MMYTDHVDLSKKKWSYRDMVVIKCVRINWMGQRHTLHFGYIYVVLDLDPQIF